MKNLMNKSSNKKLLMIVGLIMLVSIGILGRDKKVLAVNSVYTVSYNANGGTGAPATQTKKQDKVINLSTKVPKRTGYTFEGWAITSTSKNISYKPGGVYRLNKSLRLYAVWETEKYKVFYNTNGGTGTPPIQTKIYNKTLKLTSIMPKKVGYTFKGWAEAKSADKEKYKPGDNFKKNTTTTLYAVWKINTYKIKYYAYGPLEESKVQIKTYGRKIALSQWIPERVGCIFKGWATSPNAKEAEYHSGQIYTSNRSIVLYGVWKQKTYLVRYFQNGGSGGIKEQVKKHGENLVVSKSIPHRAGYVFLGWGSSSSATSISYFPGDQYKLNNPKNLYAMWGNSKSKRYEDYKAFSAIGSGVGVARVTYIYTEDYMKKPSQTYFFKHSSYLETNLSKLNDEEEFVVYAPSIIVHKDSKGKEINSFYVNCKEDTGSVKDYIFSYSNRKKVTYNNSKEVVGSSGFVIKYGSDIWAPKSIELKISGGAGKTVDKKMLSVQNMKENKSFWLGQIEKEYLDKQQKIEARCYGLREKNKNEQKELLVEGDHLIYNTDIECFVKEKELVHQVTREDILKIIHKIITERELYREAVRWGNYKSVEETNDYIAELKADLEKTNNYDEYLLFIAGTGMEEEEYWQVEIQNYQEQLTRKSYLDMLYKEYVNNQELSVSEKYSDMKELIDQKLKYNQDILKRDFIKALKDGLFEENKVIINESVLERYL